jgi:hypothetical protein
MATVVTSGVLTVTVLRELFRNLQAFHAVYENDGIDTLIGPDGTEWNLWDLEYLYRHGLRELPLRQRQAIELCLIRNVKESEAAVMMGVSPTNPVAMYATSGLTKLIGLIESGFFPRFRIEFDDERESA